MAANSSSLQMIVQTLPKLQRGELRMVLSLIRQLLPEEEATDTPGNSTGEMEEFWSVLQKWFKARHMDVPVVASIVKARNPRLYGELLQANVQFRKWLWNALDERPRKDARMSFLFLCLDLLGDSMQHANVPMSLTVIARNLVKAPALIDAQFPGYIRAGLLKIIIQQRTV